VIECAECLRHRRHYSLSGVTSLVAEWFADWKAADCCQCRLRRAVAPLSPGSREHGEVYWASAAARLQAEA